MMNKKLNGFTLVELMLAMFIFALIGLASSVVLNQMLSSDARATERREELEQLQFSLLLLERDVRQMVMRPVRQVPAEQRNIYLFSDGRYTDSDADGLAFVRAGWSNPDAMLPRSMLQPVVYRLWDGVLQRLSHSYVDDVSAEPAIQNLLHNVTDFRVEFIANGERREDWNVANRLPDVVIVSLQTDSYGRIERWLLTSGEGPLGAADEQGNPQGEGLQ
ncbi:type II secretion system protein GspJ [Aliidiomarina sedimenti]|uniref:Type II secretion system protein J n=2 Tax=Aliidiomarina sedimenti TaxID=1933879 RepID=A0ABY0BYT8_9GAMM|nr:type II secretion system protein GspJ [Aliidiomarina sedimenti]